MSFDLYVFDRAGAPASDEELGALLDDDGSEASLTPALAALVSALETRFPGADPDTSPWASWPLAQPMVGGTCCAFNIVWSEADAVRPVVVAECAARGLALHDPQADAPPRPAPSGRGWWRRRRR